MSASIQGVGKKPHIPAEVRALLSALRLSEPDTDPLLKLSDEQWTRLFGFSDFAHLTLPLARLPLDGFPQWVAERLQQNLADNATRFGRLQRLYLEAAHALTAAGVEHVVIKGFTQAPDYVSDPRFRSQWDLDLFCMREKIPAAERALLAIGYKFEEQENPTVSDHRHPLVRLGNWRWRGNFFDPEMPVSIELHFCLWNEPVLRLSVPEVESFWERRTVREIDGFVFPCLNATDHLGHFALHILRNILQRAWIVNHVRELAVFLDGHAEDNAFWQSWSAAHSASLRRLEAIVFYHARAWFGCRLHSHVEDAIASLPALHLEWLHRFSDSAFENMFHQNKDELWLHLSLLSSGGDRWHVFRQTLVPPRIASPHSSIVHNHTRSLARFDNSPLPLRYAAYLISRTSSHGSASIAALWRGLCWWVSQHRISAQFWIFMAAFFFFNLGFSTYNFLINLFLIGHGYTEKEIGLFTSAMAVGNLASALAWGKLAQRIGLRAVLLVCFTLATAIMSTRALLLSLSSQLVLAFLVGVALSAGTVCLPPAVAQLTEEKRRPFAFSLLCSLGIGIVALGGFAGSRLPGWISLHNLHFATLFPEQLVLLLSCAMCAVAIWPASRLAFIRPPATEKSRPLLSPFLLRFLPAIAVWSLVTGSFSPLANVYLARHVHLSMPQIGNAFSFAQILQVAAILLAPLLFRRWGLIGGIVLTQVVASALLLALASSANPLAASAAYVCFSAFQSMNEPGLYSLLMNRVTAQDRGGASASNSLVMSASQAIAATLAGGAFVHYGYPAALRGIALLALFAASLFWNLQGSKQRSPSPALTDAPG